MRHHVFLRQPRLQADVTHALAHYPEEPLVGHWSRRQDDAAFETTAVKAALYLDNCSSGAIKERICQAYLTPMTVRFENHGLALWVQPTNNRNRSVIFEADGHWC